MDRASLMDLIEHMYWVDHRLLDAAETLSPEAFRTAGGPTPRDLRGTFCHCVDAQQVWRCALEGMSEEEFGDRHLRPADYPDVPTLRARWAQDEAAMRGWLAILTQEDLDRPTTSFIADRSQPLWRFLTHVVLHAAHQQADAAVLLTAAGASPGEIELMDWALGVDTWRADLADGAG